MGFTIIGGSLDNGTLIGGTVIGNPNAPENVSHLGGPITIISAVIITSNPSSLPTVQQTRSLLPPPFAVSNSRSSMSHTPTSVSSSGIPGQQGLSFTLTSSPQNTATPIPNPVTGSAAPPSLSNEMMAKHGANSRIIAPVCIAILVVLLLFGVLYIKVTRKRWPFTGSRGKRVILEPFHIKHGNQVAAPRNQPLSGDSGLGDSSRGSTGNTQPGHPLVAHQPTSSAEVPIPREQLVTYYATLMREVESIAQLLTVGTRPTQPTGQSQDDGPPAYSSQVEVAGTRPPGVTREKRRSF